MRFLFILVALTLSFNSFAVRYTIEDLKVLHSEKSYNEYMKHYLDVRPSKRDFDWKRMTREMATAYADNLIAKDQINEKNFKALTKFIENKNLKAYAFFTLSYSKYANLYFKKCPHCKSDLEVFISHSARYPDIDFEIYKSLTTKLQDQYDVLVKAPLLSNDSIYYCKEAQGQSALLSILIKEISRIDTKDAIKEKAKKIFNPDCLNGISKEDIANLLAQGDYSSEIAFLTFNAFDKLDVTTKNTYLASYLLNNPIPGPIMNMAWNEIEALSADYNKRMAVFSVLKQRHPLTGEIFHRRNGKASEKSQVIIKRFAKNFPEYINFYAQTCLSFYQGSKTYPRGNPALHCDDFMSDEVAGPWLSDEIRLNYSGVKKIK